ncbi:MAG TPA: lytic transglycosylase domain-containing protein [Rhizomicrobium sp.]|jgi:soluble lytic murein transglycosylase|nr:lytic transglycosylase domain-containing protein [Rhizomicrobium sp.]
MTKLRAALLAAAATAVGAAGAFGQSPGALPPGLVQQGSVVMMHPIQDSEAGGPQISGERRNSLVKILSASDHELFLEAFSAADRGDWIAARGFADQGHDPTAKRLVQFRYLIDRNSGASFGEIAGFLKSNPDWPARDTLAARAEAAIDPTMDPHAVIAWFGSTPPVSSLGRIRYGEALIATGSVTRGRELVRQGWIDGQFDPTVESQIIQRDGGFLTPDDDAHRLNHLLLANAVTDARRELSRVDAATQRLGNVCLTLRISPEAGLREVAGLPASSQSDPGLLFDRARAMRQHGNVEAIPDLLANAPVREIASASPARWWAEMNLDARQALADGNYGASYWFAARNGLPAVGQDYADSQFLAGWVALRYLRDPKSALPHFQNLDAAVTRPISKARARYWEGRAYEAMDDDTAAWRAYHQASLIPETFYGQLALARIDATPHLRLIEPAIEPGPELRATYDGEDMTHAIRVLADLGIESLLRAFAVQDVTAYPEPKHVKLLCEDLTRMGFREVAVRAAKTLSYSGPLLLAYSYPVIAIPPYIGPNTAPDPAYVLGIIRQETEFDPDAVSGSGARGIMQMMPESARIAARENGVAYRGGDLNSDPAYNIQLGMTELAGDISNWGGSLIVAAAAYNAGPTNAKRWIDNFGDPRATTDPIDWIEHIPFEETRNYVQRVIENTQIYRVRLNGPSQPLKIMADLYRPQTPPVKVLSAPAGGAPAADAAVPVPDPRPAGQ